MHFRYSSKILSHRPQSPNVGLISIFTCPNLPATLDIKSIPVRQSPRAHLHVVGMFAVCEFDINQPSLPTPFYSVLVFFCLYGPFNCILFHKFFRRLSVFSLCSSGLISALLVLSTIYLFVKVSLSPDIILCG